MPRNKDQELAKQNGDLYSENVADAAAKVSEAYIVGISESSREHLIVAILAAVGCKYKELFDDRVQFAPFEPTEKKVVTFGTDTCHLEVGTPEQLGKELMAKMIVQHGAYTHSKPRVARSQKSCFEPISITKPTFVLPAAYVCKAIQLVRSLSTKPVAEMLACMQTYFPMSFQQTQTSGFQWKSNFLRKVYNGAICELFVPLRTKYLQLRADPTYVTKCIFALSHIEDTLWHQMHMEIQPECWTVCRELAPAMLLYSSATNNAYSNTAQKRDLIRRHV
jgi:hypothetical protein